MQAGQLLRLTAVKRWLLRHSVSMLEALPLIWLRKVEQYSTHLALVFKGASKELWDTNLNVGVSERQLIDEIEQLQPVLRKVHADLIDIRPLLKTPTLQGALDLAVFALVDMFDAAEELRWTLMELQANHSRLDQSWFANTPEGILGLFGQLQNAA